MSIDEKKRMSLYRKGLSDGAIAKECRVSRISILTWRLRRKLPANYQVVRRQT